MTHVLDPDAYQRAVRSVRLVRAQLPEIVELLQPLWRPEKPKEHSSANDDEKPDTSSPSIEDLLTKGRPVRRIVGKSTERRSGYFASRKNINEGPIAWESALEKEALWLLECDPRIGRFVTQPLTVTYAVEGRRRRHTPDIWWWRQGVPYVVEIKPAWRAVHPGVELRTQLMTDCFARFGVRYRTWRDDQIRSQPRLSNARYLLRYRDQAITAEQKFAIRSVLEERSAMTIAQLAELLSAELRPDGQDVILAMISRGHLIVDPHEPLTPRTCVTLRHSGTND